MASMLLEPMCRSVILPDLQVQLTGHSVFTILVQHAKRVRAIEIARKANPAIARRIVVSAGVSKDPDAHEDVHEVFPLA